MTPSSSRPSLRVAATCLPLAAFVALAFVPLLSGCGGEPPVVTPGMSPEQRIVLEMREALGGAEAWALATTIRFDLVERRGDEIIMRRAHDFDRETDIYTVIWTEPGQESLKATWKVSAGPSIATVARGSVQIRDEELLRQYRMRAHEFHLNDLYMTLAGYRLAEDRGTLTYYGIEPDPAGRPFQKLAVTNRPNVTLVPNYVFFVNPDTKLVESWTEMTEEGPVSWRVGGWQKSGTATVPTQHRQIGGDRSYQVTRLAIDMSQRAKRGR